MTGGIALVGVLVALAVAASPVATAMRGGSFGTNGGPVVSPGIGSPARGQTFHFLLGTGFFCAGEPDACPDIARADNGDTVAIAGEGNFTTAPRSATGDGTFVHADANGTVKASGTWHVLGLISFVSYGSAAAQGLPPEFYGGQLLLRVHIQPDAGGPGFLGVLKVQCLLGDHVPMGAHEGVRIVVQGTPFNFNKSVSGDTLYILL